MALGKNLRGKKVKGKQYHLFYNTMAVKNIMRGKGMDISGKKIKIIKMGVGKNIKL